MTAAPRPAADEPDPAPVRDHLMALQDTICRALEEVDGTARFVEKRFEAPTGGLHRPRVVQDGPVIEKAAVQFSHSIGRSMPAAATERRPELAGRDYQAVSVSLIVHPRNPYAPTSHANFRFFVAGAATDDPVWWFGGGFDLTPYYGFEEDCVHWHRVAERACADFGDDVYPRMKHRCDEYFHLPHRDEPRGIGGLFYDDDAEGGFDRAFALHRAIGHAYLEAYRPILERRKDTPHGERERQWQLLRRGRYAEFNLAYDRGTRFGLEAGARTESILASLPPLVRWETDHETTPGTEEHRLLTDFLVPRDWLASGPTP